MPVDGIEDKLLALETWLDEKKACTAKRYEQVFFFTPMLTTDGRKMVDAYQLRFEDLAARAKANGVTLRIRPVKTLGEAAALIGADTLPLDRREMSRQIGVYSGATVLVACILSIFLWTASAAPLRLAPIEWSLGPPLKSPTAMIIDRALGSRTPRTTCYAKDGRPQIRYGTVSEAVVTRVVSEPTNMSSTLHHQFYDYLAVLLGEISRPQVFPIDAINPEGRPRPTADGSIALAFARTAASPDEAMQLVFLSRRAVRPLFGLGTFAPRQIEQDLLALHEAEPDPSRRVATMNTYLADLRGDFLSIDYRTVAEFDNCQEALE